MFNEYGICGFDKSEENTFAHRWLGALVECTALGRRVQGEVHQTDEINRTLMIKVRDGSKIIQIEAPYQAFKRKQSQ